MPDGVPDGNSICKLIESIDSSSAYNATAYKDAGGYYED
jgi:hypothetical protein